MYDRSISGSTFFAVLAAFAAPAAIALAYDFEMIGLAAIVSTFVLPAIGAYAAARLGWMGPLRSRSLLVYSVAAILPAIFWGYIALFAVEGADLASWCFVIYCVAAIAAGLVLFVENRRNG
ncbi:MAG: hypothetical protein KF708_16805 [Pirellulales bacterium]|nr:hypothetical protein [Pirellulales bacterium]